MTNLEKRSMRIAGHRTSIALEPEFWRAVEANAKTAGQTMPVYIAGIDDARDEGRQSLASALRCAALAKARGVAR